MKYYFIAIFVLASFCVAAQNLTTYKSHRTVEETVDRIVEIIKQKKLVYFETVNHDKVALEYGVEIPPTRMIL